MPNSSEIILSATSHPGDSTITVVSGEKFKGDGYYGRSDGIHTVQYNVNQFEGTVAIQATLATTPAEADWFTVSGTDNVASTGSFIFNFTGNYVWVRAYISNFTSGTVNSILLNH
jgi:hypothetical protein|tara:strand:+ start:317 stop:661 length:345 start_codon:yes stop_codon:yes gene_type:complete